jgi:zinc and cadmium transporter
LLLVPLAAGGFIYIAGSDLVPELHKEANPVKSAVQLVGMSAGVGIMLLLTKMK